VGKHFSITITDDQLSFTRDHAAIAKEAALDGFYVLRTNVPADAINTADTVRAYKSLARVERAFRSLKTIDLDIRPIYHWVSPRVPFSCACSPIISNGICARRWRLSCSTITTAPPPKPCARRQSRRQSLRRPPSAKPKRSTRTTDSRFTASAHCSPI